MVDQLGEDMFEIRDRSLNMARGGGDGGESRGS
jgi:hypothetical protein